MSKCAPGYILAVTYVMRENISHPVAVTMFSCPLVSTGADWTAHCSSLLLLMELQERVELWTWTPIFVAGV